MKSHRLSFFERLNLFMDTQNPNLKRVLIAEDEKPMAKALQHKLEKEGFSGEIAGDGEQAIEMIKNNTYDLILLDLIMPKLDGFSVLAEMNALQNKTPVIITSNLSQDEDIKKAKNLGAIDFLVKSDVSLAQVVERIKFFLKI